MDAQMSRYQQVDRNVRRVPHRYIVRWPKHDAQMNLDLRSVQFTLKLPEDAFDFPRGTRQSSRSTAARGPQAVTRAPGPTRPLRCRLAWRSCCLGHPPFSRRPQRRRRRTAGALSPRR